MYIEICIYIYQFKSLSTIIFVNSSSLLLKNTTNKATLSNKRQLSKINFQKKGLFTFTASFSTHFSIKYKFQQLRSNINFLIVSFHKNDTEYPKIVVHQIINKVSGITFY